MIPELSEIKSERDARLAELLTAYEALALLVVKYQQQWATDNDIDECLWGEATDDFDPLLARISLLQIRYGEMRAREHPSIVKELQEAAEAEEAETKAAGELRTKVAEMEALIARLKAEADARERGPKTPHKVKTIRASAEVAEKKDEAPDERDGGHPAEHAYPVRYEREAQARTCIAAHPRERLVAHFREGVWLVEQAFPEAAETESEMEPEEAAGKDGHNMSIRESILHAFNGNLERLGAADVAHRTTLTKTQANNALSDLLRLRLLTRPERGVYALAFPKAQTLKKFQEYLQR